MNSQRKGGVDWLGYSSEDAVMRAACALLLALLMLPAAALAKTITARGEGAAACSAWTQEHENKTSRRPVQDSWILGYVNAAAAMLELPGVDDVSGSFRNRDLVTWIDDYCGTNPDKPLIIAADALMRYLARRATGADQTDGPKTFDP